MSEVVSGKDITSCSRSRRHQRPGQSGNAEWRSVHSHSYRRHFCQWGQGTGHWPCWHRIRCHWSRPLSCCCHYLYWEPRWWEQWAGLGLCNLKKRNHILSPLLLVNCAWCLRTNALVFVLSSSFHISAYFNLLLWYALPPLSSLLISSLFIIQGKVHLSSFPDHPDASKPVCHELTRKFLIFFFFWYLTIQDLLVVI